MQLTTFSTFLTLLLPLTTVATPIPTPNADLAQAATDISYDSSPAALAKRTLDERKYKTSYLCDIVNVVTEVDCWAFPQHGGKGPALLPNPTRKHSLRSRSFCSDSSYIPASPSLPTM
ncbi:hypothetical protein FQN53_007747 [Emmonsiellopsis sp. PD_33]|nr:hypothetical protein FQN53_007747 [Emmonsiellopsis sp. PD_33]